MLPEQRKRRVVELVREHGGRSVGALAEELDVSKATMRRDLSDLEADGLIERSHGGAVPAAAVGHEQSYDQREVQRLDEKVAIGEAAVEEIHGGDVALFDSGTTTMQAAKAVPPDTDFVGATNSPLIALELSSQDVEVTLAGGTLRERTRSLVGPSAESFLEQRYFDVALVATNAIHDDGSLSTPDEAEAQVKSLMVSRAERVVLLADATKYGERSVVEFGDLADVDLLVSDAAPEGELADVLAEHDVQTAIVSPR